MIWPPSEVKETAESAAAVEAPMARAAAAATAKVLSPIGRSRCRRAAVGAVWWCERSEAEHRCFQASRRASSYREG